MQVTLTVYTSDFELTVPTAIRFSTLLQTISDLGLTPGTPQDSQSHFTNIPSTCHQ